MQIVEPLRGRHHVIGSGVGVAVRGILWPSGVKSGSRTKRCLELPAGSGVALVTSTAVPPSATIVAMIALATIETAISRTRSPIVGPGQGRARISRPALTSPTAV